MDLFFKKNRSQFIESLEFFYFLQKLVVSLRGTYGKSTNPLILSFLKVLEEFYSWESRKNYPYIRALTDQVFWRRSGNFYRQAMLKLIDGEFNALEFAEEFSDRLLADRKQANDLLKDFEEQAKIELNPNIYEFSKIILNFELMLEVYQNEAENFETGELSEQDLSFTPDSILKGVQHELKKINQYFTD